MTSCYVLDQQWRFVCIAQMNHTGGAYGTEASRRQAKEVARQRRQFNRAVKEYRDGAPLQLHTAEERLVIESQK